VPEVEADAAMTAYLQSFKEPLLPVYEMDEAMSVLRGRIDADLTEEILKINSEYKNSLLHNQSSSPSKQSSACVEDYPSGAILTVLHKHCVSLPQDQRSAFYNQTALVWAAAEQYLYSTEVRILSGLLKFVEAYLEVEKLFDNMSFTDVVSELRKDNISDLGKVLGLCRSHINLKAKNILLVKVMDEMTLLPIESSQRPAYPPGVPVKFDINTRNLKLRLTALARLKQPMYSHVSFVANLVLMKQYSLKPEQRRRLMHEAISEVLTTGEAAGHPDRVAHFKKFIESNVVIRDLLLEALRNDKDYQIAVMELYLLKTYQTTHTFQNMESGTSLGATFISPSHLSPWLKFEFKTKQVVGVADSVSGMSFNELSTAQRSENAAIDEEIPASDLTHPLVRGVRVGIMAVVDTIADLAAQFPLVLAKVPFKQEEQSTVVNAVHIVLMQNNYKDATTDDEFAAAISTFLGTQKAVLGTHGIRRVTFFVPALNGKTSTVMHGSSGATGGIQPSIFTFRYRHGFVEDSLYRNIEAPHAYHLDLTRLKNFKVTLDTMQTTSGNVFLYKALPLGIKGPERYFSRLVSFSDIHSNDGESLFVEALDNLSLVIGQQEAAGGAVKASAANHVFLNIVAPDTVVAADYFDKELKRICTKYWYKMVRLAVSTVEMKISCRLVAGGEPLLIRLVASNPTGFVLKVDRYFEATCGTGRRVFKTIGDGVASTTSTVPGSLEGLDTQTPYEISQKFERQRAEAMASSDTLYVYDWPMLFESAVGEQWDSFDKENEGKGVKRPSELFSCKELVIHDPVTKGPLAKGWAYADAEKGVMVPVTRDPGMNDVGMVAWLAKLSTPECPGGREVVLICNDITHQAGSFGTKEDIVFFKASEYARARGLPRFFLAANSGARIGMAQSLKSLFQVCWSDERDPSKGFKYIYLSKFDYNALLTKYNGDVEKMPLFCSLIKGPKDEERYLITDIIGEVLMFSHCTAPRFS
jgi:acetyl-CoA carboxylase / biotin carboxylase 1